MEKKMKLGIILLVILIIVNAIIGGSILLFVMDINAPDIDVHIQVQDLSEDDMTFTATITMGNTNPFDLSIDNLELIGKNPAGATILTIELQGGTIPAQQHKTLVTNQSVSFTGDMSSTLYSSIQGTMGVTIGGLMEKTIPFHVNITASFSELLNNIDSPTIDITAEVADVTENGVIFQATVSLDNPNSFSLELQNLATRITTENGTLVGELTPLQGIIRPDDTTRFHMNGTLYYHALNAKVLTIDLSGKAAVHLMGLTKAIGLSASAHLIVPNITELLFHNESLVISITLDAKLRLRGVLATIGLRLSNPSKIPLQAHDMLCSIYGLTGENKKMIVQQPMEACTIEPQNQNCAETEVRIPYIKFFTSGTRHIFPEWFVIEIKGNFSIEGVYQSIPVSLDANINPTLFR
ncbi:MAG: DUF3712 domain-containing protein [Candidatus Thermoplasmatota archaeon]|nr:DUF3712 domain-containing protein [Candidatus Thermoplasmatota archaeon]